MVSRCQHRWLWRRAHSEGGQGTAACHHEIADAYLLGPVLDASGTLLDEQVRERVQSDDRMCCRRATAIQTPQSVNAHAPSLVHGVLADGALPTESVMPHADGQSYLDRTALWPSLPLAAWQDTYATLHMWTQIVGKIRLALSPPVNHWWHVTLYVTSRGLTTSPIPYGSRTWKRNINSEFILLNSSAQS